MIEKINEILHYTVKVDSQKKVDEKTVILRDLEINSMELVSLICAVEDEFDIEIPDKALKRIITIGDLMAFIKSQEQFI